MSEKEDSQVLYMPAISLVVPNGSKYDHGSITYTYSPINAVKESITSKIMNGMIAAVTFVIAVFLFSIPVTLASLLLISSISSPLDMSKQNQDVPGVVNVVPHQDYNPNKTIEPAN